MQITDSMPPAGCTRVGTSSLASTPDVAEHHNCSPTTWRRTSRSHWTCWCGRGRDRAESPRRNRDTLPSFCMVLEEYDPTLRRKSGSYYTPHDVIEQMVRLAEDVLVEKLHRPDGFADP